MDNFGLEGGCPLQNKPLTFKLVKCFIGKYNVCRIDQEVVFYIVHIQIFIFFLVET